MYKAPNLLLIGGNARHIGKTTLACRIIKKFSSDFSIVSLKVTSIYEGDASYHGDHELLNSEKFGIIREKSSEGTKDTALMLRHGSKESFYIQAKDDFVEHAWVEFQKQIPSNCLLVCESRSLRRFVEPGLFIYMKSSRVKKDKPYNEWLEKAANAVLIDPEMETLGLFCERVFIEQYGWKLAEI